MRPSLRLGGDERHDDDGDALDEQRGPDELHDERRPDQGQDAADHHDQATENTHEATIDVAGRDEADDLGDAKDNDRNGNEPDEKSYDRTAKRNFYSLRA